MSINHNKIKFSIITVCYNCESSIEETILSLIGQKYDEYEYIIVDGKSTDNTLNILKEFKNVYSDKITVISEEDFGIYDAMNKGLKVAKGDYIFFLNAGDRFYDDEVLNKVCKELSVGGIDILYGDIVLMNKKGSETIKSMKKVSKFGFLIDRTICHQAIFSSMRSFEISGNFNIKYIITADYDWSISCYKNNLNFKHIPILIAYYDLNGISSKNLELILKEHENIIKMQFGIIEFCFSKVMHIVVKYLIKRGKL